LKPRLAELLITCGTFIFCWTYFTPVGGDEAGSIPFNLAGGQFCNFSFINFFYLSFFVVSYIYKFFYHLFPTLNCMGIGFAFLEFAALYLVLRAIKTVILPGRDVLFVTAIQILFALYFCENIVVLSHTRFSFVLCGIALFNLLFSNKVSRRAILINTVIFLTGLLHRPESSVGMLTLVSLGYLVYRFNPLFVVKRLFFPGLLVVVMLLGFAVDWALTDTFVRKVEPEVEYKLMAHRVVDLSVMKTPVDSIKYELATHGMWFDPRVLTTQYLRSILVPGMDLSPQHAYAVLLHVFSWYRYCIFVPVLLMVLFFLAVFKGKWLVGAKVLLFQAITFCIIYYADYNGFLIASRHFLNLQLLSLLIVCYYFFADSGASDVLAKYKYLYLLILIPVGAAAVNTITNYKNSNTVALTDIADKEQLMGKVESTYSGRTIVVTLAGFQLFDHRFSVRNIKYQNNKYILFDVLSHQLLPVYMNYLNSQCHCDALNPVQFYNWLEESKALYISDSAQCMLTEKYMQIIYADKVMFIRPINLNKMAGVDNFGTRDCEIREVTIEK